jgi:glycosyltransferase involved in cell wall biosynthesis
MDNKPPKLSIGLPVYNGERFLAQCIDSLLGQTFSDFELIISDNASTDSTAEICRDYAAKDSRVRYFRSDENRGAAWNFNNTYHMACGEYFKWAAHDDLHHRDFLRKCTDELVADPTLVLCFTRTIFIDAGGNELGEYVSRECASHLTRRGEFFFYASTGFINVEIFGVIRASALRKTALIGSYVGSDIVMLGELALLGGVRQVPECLFFHREHSGRSALAAPTAQSYTQWFDPRKQGKFAMPHWRRLFEHARSVFRHRLAWTERAVLLYDTCRAANWWRKALVEDVLRLMRQN